MTAVAVVLVLGGYTLYLSREVRVKFDGKRWAVPAQVYARPLELYVGATVSPDQLAHELGALGYRRVGRPRRAAEWSRTGGRFLVHTRPFRFWDDELPAQRLEVRFDAGAISALRDFHSGQSHDLIRLEPAQIGSIYPAHNEDRLLVRYEDLPPHLIAALLAVEDRGFYHHHGIDPRGILRALWSNLKAGRTVQGGSTLTQQLAKNFFLTPERSLWRKFNELLIALIIEARFEKNEILEAYANEIFLGQDGARAIHGFGLAAQYYFNRPVGELSLPEAAMLVGLVKGASYYNPRRHPERARSRRDLVIDQLLQLGQIPEDLAQKAKQVPLKVVAAGGSVTHRYPGVIDLIRRQLRRDYREEDLTSEGLRVFTTLDPWLQQLAQQALAARLKKLEQWRKLEHGTLEGAVVLTAAQSGEVLALVGGRRAGYAGFNRALDAVRPIGSLVKPAVFLAALTDSARFQLTTQLEDRALSLKDERGRVWAPKNYDRKEHGVVPLHRTLSKSYNLATVRLGLDVGLDRVVRTLRALGVDKSIQPYPSLLLGALSLSPFEVTQMYQTLASGGYRAPLRAIREVTDAEGHVLHRFPLSVKRAVSAEAVFLLVRNLVEVVEAGTAAKLRQFYTRGAKVAGKTGTTNDLRDSWYAGFGADLVGVVWVGRDDNGPIGYSGAAAAMPVWGQIMQRAVPVGLDPTPPEGVHYVWVEPDTGLRSAEGCEGAKAFPFIVGSAPERSSNCAGGGVSDFLRDFFN